MATIDELVVQIAADTSGLRSELKAGQEALKQALERMGKETEQFGRDGSGNMNMFQQAVATMAGVVGGQAITAAFGVLKDAASALFNTFVVDGISAANETQTALNNLSNALARNGNLLPGVSKSFEEFGAAIQNTTVYGDDAALSAASLIENLTKLDADGLKNATTAATDLAAALGIDLQSAASLVGKAMNGNVSSLQRYGIEIEKTTDASRQADVVLKTLTDRFGGAAKAQVNTFAGATTVLSNAFSDLTKVFGFAVIENKAVVAVVKTITDIVAELTEGLGANAQSMREWIAQGLVVAIDTAGYLGTVLQELFKVVETGVRAFQIAGTAIGGVMSAIANITKPQQALEALKASFADVAALMAKPVEGSQFLGTFLDKLAEVKGAADRGFQATVAGATATIAPLNNASEAMKKLSAEQQLALDQAVEFSTKLAESADSSSERFTIQSEMLRVSRETDLLTDAEYFAAKEELLNQNIMNEQAMLDQAIASGKISREQYAQAQFALTAKANTDQLKLMQDRKAAEDRFDKERLANLQSTFSTIATLSSTNNKTLSTIGKAAAVSDATINAYKAANVALGSAPPPFNFGLAAAVTAAGIANVAKIVGTPLQTGIDSVPGIGFQDSFPAVLAPGERVVPRETNTDLSKFLAEQRSEPRQVVNLSISISDVFATDPREIGTRIVEMINEASQANGVRILGATPA